MSKRGGGEKQQMKKGAGMEEEEKLVRGCSTVGNNSTLLCCAEASGTHWCKNLLSSQTTIPLTLWVHILFQTVCEIKYVERRVEEEIRGVARCFSPAGRQ